MNSAPTDARISTSAFDRKPHGPHSSTPHSRSVHVPQGKSVSSLTVAAPATADDRQADYFMRLLTQSRQAIEQRIDAHQKAIAAAEACGNLHDVRRHRQLTLTAEQDRRTVADLIDNLRRRFQVPQRVRPVR